MLYQIQAYFGFHWNHYCLVSTRQQAIHWRGICSKTGYPTRVIDHDSGEVLEIPDKNGH